MSDRMKKALRDGGKITVTIQYNYMTGFHYDIREEAFRLTGIASGEIANEALENEAKNRLSRWCRPWVLRRKWA